MNRQEGVAVHEVVNVEDSFNNLGFGETNEERDIIFGVMDIMVAEEASFNFILNINLSSMNSLSSFFATRDGIIILNPIKIKEKENLLLGKYADNDEYLKKAKNMLEWERSAEGSTGRDKLRYLSYRYKHTQKVDQD